MPAIENRKQRASRTVYYSACEDWRETALQTLLSETCPELHCERESSASRVEYLDTFDWLLLRASQVVERGTVNGSGWLSLRALDATSRRAPQPVPPGPIEVHQVGGRFLRSELALLCGERALIPVATVRRVAARFTLRDVAGKQRLRVELREERNVGRGRRAVRQRLALMPLAGYATDARRVRDALRLAGWEPAREPMLEALETTGRQPFDYPPPTPQELRIDMPTRRAFSLIGLHLLDVMEANVAGLRADTDVEFLHDFRVALRRTRTLLAQVRDVLPAAKVRRFKDGFRWLGGVSGAARDGDVQVKEIDSLVASRPAGDHDALAPLQVWIREQRSEAREVLLKALASARFERLCRDWRALLEHTPTRTRLANAGRPLGEVAAELVAATFNHLIRKGSRITDASPPAHLHELRKVAKKLRYLVEFFRPLYDPRRVEVLVSDLKQLQENLGEYQDLDVQRALLERFAALAPAQTAELLVGLTQAMRARETRVRAEFAGRFKSFSSPRVRRHLRAMLEKRRPAAGS